MSIHHDFTNFHSFRIFCRFNAFRGHDDAPDCPCCYFSWLCSLLAGEAVESGHYDSLFDLLHFEHNIGIDLVSSIIFMVTKNSVISPQSQRHVAY